MYTKRKLDQVIVLMILTIGGILMVTPFIWMILTSFKVEREAMLMPPTFLPQAPTIQNYITLFKELNFLTYFRNTIVVVMFSFVGMFLNAMAGYAFAKFKFPAKNILFYILFTYL